MDKANIKNRQSKLKQSATSNMITSNVGGNLADNAA